MDNQVDNKENNDYSRKINVQESIVIKNEVNEENEVFEENMAIEENKVIQENKAEVIIGEKELVPEEGDGSE